MPVEVSDPAPYHSRIHSLQFPPLPSVRIRVDRTRAAVHHSLRAFPFHLVFLRVPVRTRPSGFPRAFAFAFPAAPVVRFRFILISPRPHCVPLRVPSHRARASSIVCVPTAYVSAASLRALVCTVFHILSPLPLSCDAHQLVTSSCCIQVGCSG